MTDRIFTYPGALPQDSDILQPQRNMMIALGFMAQAAFGSSTLVDGLAISATAPASMSLNIAPGVIIQNSVVDQTAYGSLAADTADALVKVGINIATTVLGPFTAPGTSGQSQNFLIQGALSETDGGATVLPYYNAANPSAPYSGPNNTGSAQNTKRIQTVNLQIKAGTPATTGSQTTPAPDTGYVGLWVVTIANGASSLTSANFFTYYTAPFIPNKLGPGMWPGFAHKQPFYSSGTFTVPQGVTALRVTVVAGGSGSSGCSSISFAGCCGAGGGWAIKNISGLTPGTQIAVTVGAGGAGSAANTASTAGGSSSFGAFCSATGGGAAATSAGHNNGGTGGVGAGGDVFGDGEDGSDGNPNTPSGTNYWPGKSGGSLFGGATRCGQATTSPAGSGGGAPGAGASSPYYLATNATGQTGGGGAVIVEW